MATVLDPDSGDRTERAARLLVPAGLAALTWLVVLVGVALLARLGSLSILNLLPLFVLAAMAWPVRFFAPWRPGATARFRAWAREYRHVLVVTAALAAATAVPFVPDLFITVLHVPYRGSGILFGAEVFYRRHAGPAFARAVFLAAQWYLELVWLYLLAGGIVAIGRRVRP